MPKRSPAEMKQAASEMQSRIDAIPAATHGPLMRYDESLVASLESVLNGLKSFIRFLSKLNPVEYLQWMFDAYSRFIRSETDLISEASTTSAVDEVPSFLDLPETPQQNLKTKKRIKFFSKT